MTRLPCSIEIRKKVEAGERLSAAEGEFLFSPEVDLHALGELADAGATAQERQCGLLQSQYAHQSRPTSASSLRLCAYSCDEDDPPATR